MADIQYTQLLKDADILLIFNKKSFLHKIIHWVTKPESDSKYIPEGWKAGHVAIYLTKGIIAEALGDGIGKKRLRTYNDKKYKLFIARCDKLTEELKNKIIIEALKIERTGTKYAFFQLPLFLLHKFFKVENVPDVSKKAMICSEYVAESYKKAGVPLFNKDSEEVNPNDFFESTLLKIIEVPA